MSQQARRAGREKTMMTKDQEREVLRQIVKLIESTDADSYIRTAFDGCIQDAEDNITDDAAYSWKDRAQTAEKKRIAAEHAAQTAEDRAQKAEQKQAEQEATIERLRSDLKKAAESSVTNWNEYRKAEDEAEALKQQVIELKAKLYDYMVKG